MKSNIITLIKITNDKVTKMNKILNQKTWRNTLKVLIILAGALIMAAGNMVFLNPYDIVPGGFTGFAIILNKVFIPFITPGIISIILNIPLFIAAFKIKGFKFSLLSLTGMLGYSIFIDIIPLFNLDPKTITDNALLATIYGGILLGVGYGIIIRQGGSTGGSDTLASILRVKKPSLTFGTILLFIDAFVVLFSGTAFSIKYGGIQYGIPPALYAFLAIFLSSIIADYVVEGAKSSRAYFIFCADPESVSEAILSKLKRGVTSLHAKGMYTKREKDVLFCVVLRTESAALKQIIFEKDPSAFITSANTSEVFGEGFEKHIIAAKKNLKNN